ncbi:MAG: FKBP-type peptidyl-prolyl cis-trans isomerase [Methanoregulaceae archaeon]|nr:FKBP-type peptidyl-prolyl cis-trans isomerase [Methanoregulaceae archaeon]
MKGLLPDGRLRGIFSVVAVLGVVAMSAISAGCVGGQNRAVTGKTVLVHYTATFQNGTVYESTLNRSPLRFTLGRNEVVPGFEDAVTGMAAGESKRVYIPAERAYGPYRPELVVVLNRTGPLAALHPNPGDTLRFILPDNRTGELPVIAVNDSAVTLDGNNPLAGKNFWFELTLVKIV